MLAEKQQLIARVPRAEHQGSHVEYVVECTKGDISWSVRRRFKNFVLLHKKLKSRLPKGLELPPKTIRLGSKKFDKQFVAKRRAQLEAYLKELLNHVDPEFSPIIDDFLEFSEHILLGSLLNLEGIEELREVVQRVIDAVNSCKAIDADAITPRLVRHDSSTSIKDRSQEGFSSTVMFASPAATPEAKEEEAAKASPDFLVDSDDTEDESLASDLGSPASAYERYRPSPGNPFAPPMTTPGSIPSAAKDRFTRRRSSISVAEDANLYEVLRQSSAEIRDHLVGLEKATHDVDLVLQAKASVTRALTNQHSSKLEELTQAKQALTRRKRELKAKVVDVKKSLHAKRKEEMNLLAQRRTLAEELNSLRLRRRLHHSAFKQNLYQLNQMRHGVIRAMRANDAFGSNSAPSPASTSRRTLSSESKGDSDMDVLSPLPSPALTSEALAEAEAAQQAVPGAGGGLGYLGQEKELRKALAMCGDFLKDMQDAMKALKVAPTMVRCREWWRSRVWESEATTDFASAPGPAGSPAKDAAEELKETDIEPVQAQQRQLKEDTNKLVALQLSGPNLTAMNLAAWLAQNSMARVLEDALSRAPPAYAETQRQQFEQKTEKMETMLRQSASKLSKKHKEGAIPRHRPASASRRQPQRKDDRPAKAPVAMRRASTSIEMFKGATDESRSGSLPTQLDLPK